MSTIRAESKITGVTVFESSAQVRRETTIDKMPKGEVNIVFADLPQNLDRDNVQVAVRFEQEEQKKQDAATDKAASCSLRGVSFKTETVTVEERKDSSAEREVLTKKTKELAAQLIVLQDELADVSSTFMRDCLKSALTGDRKEEDANKVLGDVSYWKKMFETTHSEDKDSLTKKRELEKQIAALNEELNLVRRNLNSLGGGNVTTTKNVVIVSLLASRELVNVDVRISYVVTSAKWSAEYDVRYDPEKSEANVTYNAVVSQTGSEVWPNVILTISTARPTISGKPVELSPWRTSVYVPPPMMHRSRNMAKGKKNVTLELEECKMEKCMDMNMDLDCEDDDESAALDARSMAQFVAPTIQTAAVKEGATSMTFCLENHPYTVLNTGKSVRVTLAIVPVKSSVSYITRPKLTETVFAQMKAVNLSNFTLLPGPALVFCGQQFISKTTLSRCSPTDEFTVNLGADNDVVVKYRRLKNERKESSGVFSGSKVKFSVGTRITVNNRKKTPIDIVVEDQIPISQHSDIEVVMVQPPPPEENDKVAKDNLREGKVVYDLKLQPQTEKVLSIEFTVQHPKDFDMEGL